MNDSQNFSQLQTDSMGPRNLTRLKWSSTIAVVGIPVLVQILGAAILFSPQYEFLSSGLFVFAFCVAALMVVTAGIFTITNRVFLRFLRTRRHLQEWEIKTQDDAFSFSYRTILKGIFAGFACVSLLGAMQAIGLADFYQFEFGQNISLNLPAIAAVVIMITYLILFLPTLYIAWTINPLEAE